MKLIRKMTALALTVLLAVTLSVPALAADSLYQDTPNTAALELLKLVNVFDGYTDGNFRGENVLTRAQLTKVACQLMGVEVDAAAVPAFADARDNWAAAYIAAAAKAGIVQGKTTERFVPDEPVTRYQAAMMFARMVGFDDSKIASLPWAERVEAAVKAAKLDGFLTLDNGALTRMEAANAAYTTLLAKHLNPSELSGALTSNTLAGKLGISAESGKLADGTATIRFVLYKNGIYKTNAFAVPAGNTLPEATAAPETTTVSVHNSATVYGYVVGEAGHALWGNGSVYNQVTMWSGDRLGELTTTASIPSQRPLVAVLKRGTDGEILRTEFCYASNGLYEGAVVSYEADSHMWLADGTVRYITDDTQFLFIDSSATDPEKVGCASRDLLEARLAADGVTYVNNIYYTLDQNGKLACVIQDINNQIPALS